MLTHNVARYRCLEEYYQNDNLLEDIFYCSKPLAPTGFLLFQDEGERVELVEFFLKDKGKSAFFELFKQQLDNFDVVRSYFFDTKDKALTFLRVCYGISYYQEGPF